MVEAIGKNQFIIHNEDNGRLFQSYKSNIAYIPYDRDQKIQIGKDWNYSKTTAKYLRAFLGEGTNVIKLKIKEGIYIYNEDL